MRRSPYNKAAERQVDAVGYHHSGRAVMAYEEMCRAERKKAQKRRKNARAAANKAAVASRDGRTCGPNAARLADEVAAEEPAPAPPPSRLAAIPTSGSASSSAESGAVSA